MHTIFDTTAVPREAGLGPAARTDADMWEAGLCPETSDGRLGGAQWPVRDTRREAGLRPEARGQNKVYKASMPASVGAAFRIRGSDAKGPP